MTGTAGPPARAEAAAVERAAEVLGGRARRDVPIGLLTTYRVGGRASLFLAAAGEDDLALAAAAVEASGVPVLVVGRGSNLLVADAGFAGLVVTLGAAFAEVVPLDGDRVRAGAAASLPVVARRTVAIGLTGFEWAVGVPGSVGGAVRMNAGGHGSDISRSLVRFRSVRLTGTDAGSLVEGGPDELAYGYRRSSIEPGQVVVSADLQLARGDRGRSEEAVAEIVRWRREHQPGGQNAGSVFTNPPHDSAGRLVDAAGLKGRRRGSAFVSLKHANFFQVEEGGSADDVRALVEEVARLVEERTGVRLHPELQMVGFSMSSGG